MPTYDRNLTSGIGFSSRMARTHDGVLTSGIGFSSGEAADWGRPLESAIGFGSIFCSDAEFLRLLTSGIGFASYIRFVINSLSDPRNTPPSGISPPGGFRLRPQWSRRLASGIGFGSVLVGQGGYVYDYSCSPPVLIPNFPPVGTLHWHLLTDGEWSQIDDSGWDYLEE